MSADQAVAAAQPHATGKLMSISWPTDQKAEWKIGFARQGGPAEVVVADESGGSEGAEAATAGNTRSHNAALARRHRHGRWSGR